MSDFSVLVERLYQTEGEDELSSILSSLNGLFYPVSGLEDKYINIFFTTVLHSKSLHQPTLIIKWTHLIHTLLTSQNAPLSTDLANSLFLKILSFLQLCPNPTEPLYALSALVPHVDLSSKLVEGLLNSGSPVVQSLSDKSIPIQRAALDCLAALCYNIEVSPFILNGLLEVLVQLLNNTIPDLQATLLHLKLQASILRAMLNILTCVGSLQPLPLLPTLLALLKALMTTGLPGHQPPRVTTPLTPHPDTMAVSTAYRSPSVAGPKQRRQRKRGTGGTKSHDPSTTPTSSTPLSHSGSEGEGSDSKPRKRDSTRRRGHTDKRYMPPSSSTSESELSDGSSSSGGGGNHKDVTRRIRHSSLMSLAAIFQSLDRHSAFSYGLPFLPDSPRPHSAPPTIFTCLCKDPIYKCRSAASVVLTAILEGSRSFIAVADDRPAPARPFTPYSTTLGGVIQELHRNLLLSLTAEHVPLTLTHILKCLSILVINAPYSSLSNHYISNIVSTLEPLTTRPDTDVTVGALTCYGAILSLNPPVSDVEAWLNDDTPPGGFPWIVNHCLSLVESRDTAQSLKMEAIQVLTAVIKFNIHVVSHSWTVLSQLYCTYMSKFSEPLQQHSLRYLEELGRVVSSFSKDDLPAVVSHWESLLLGPLTYWLQNGDKYPSSCSQGCSVVATIGNSVLEGIKPQSRVLILTILLGLSRDSNSSVKSSAMRSLGVFCQYPCLSDDTGFLMDCAERLKEGLDLKEQLSVRTQAGWAAGNLTDSFNSDESRVEVLPFLFPSLVACATLAMKDNEKVKVNAVRASGNLLKILSSGVLKNSGSQLSTMCSLLIEAVNVGGMKTRWNACYACFNALSNTCFTSNYPDCVASMLIGLCTAVTTCKNFKVRTNAALALSSLAVFPSTDQFIHVWNSLLKAPESTLEQHDFGEYKQATALKRQVCVSLCELAMKIDTEILSQLTFTLPTFIRSELVQFVLQSKSEDYMKENLLRMLDTVRVCKSVHKLDHQLLLNNKGMKEFMDILDSSTVDK